MTGPVTTEARVETLRQGGQCSDPCKVKNAESGCTCAQAADALQQVTAERDEAREVVARCNNSFGSYSYHLNPHPAEQIEKVKWQARSEWQRAEAAEASLATATSELVRLRAENAELRTELDALIQEVMGK